MSGHDDDYYFEESSGSGASDTFPQQCSALRKNGFVMIKKKPCKIIEMTTSKTGKHGHAKVHLVGIDIFTSKKYEDICPSTHNMHVPNVSRNDYQLVDIEDEYLHLMDQSGNIFQDIKLPQDQDLSDRIVSEFNGGESNIMITVLKACGEEQVVGIKNSDK